jgi:hypothetical protein
MFREMNLAYLSQILERQYLPKTPTQITSSTDIVDL